MNACFTMIPNILIETIPKTKLTPNEHRILYVIYRKTFGWRKNKDWVAYSQIEKATGIAKRNVWRSVKSLLNKKILIRHGKLMGIHPNLLAAENTTSGVSSELRRDVLAPETEVSSGLRTTKETTKKMNTKEGNSLKSFKKSLGKEQVSLTELIKGIGKDM